MKTEHEEALKELRKLRAELKQNQDTDEKLLADPLWVVRAIDYCLFKKAQLSASVQVSARKACDDLKSVS